MAATEPLMKMVLHCIDRIKSFKLSKEVFNFLFRRPKNWHGASILPAPDRIKLWLFVWHACMHIIYLRMNILTLCIFIKTNIAPRMGLISDMRILLCFLLFVKQLQQSNMLKKIFFEMKDTDIGGSAGQRGITSISMMTVCIFNYVQSWWTCFSLEYSLSWPSWFPGIPYLPPLVSALRPKFIYSFQGISEKTFVECWINLRTETLQSAFV